MIKLLMGLVGLVGFASFWAGAVLYAMWLFRKIELISPEERKSMESSPGSAFFFQNEAMRSDEELAKRRRRMFAAFWIMPIAFVTNIALAAAGGLLTI